MSFKVNALNATDSYKLQHVFQYPKGTTQVYSNLTARSDKHFNAPAEYHDGKIVFFGLQGAWKDIVEIWNETFFGIPKADAVASYAKRISPFVGKDPGDVVVSHIEALHDLGYLPILLKALPEGSRVNMKIPLLTITNTLPEFFWLVNYLETWLSDETWKPMTTATTAYTFRKILEDYAEKTGSPKEFIPWQGHDFSCRGMSGMVDAAKCGAGHLLSFTGSDTVSAVDYLEWAYDGDKTFVCGSVAASEHSVMTMGGPEGEMGIIKRLITEVHPSGIVSVVSDSYDFWKVITEGAASLKEDILARGKDAFGNSKVVFRPDSSDPADVICGTARHVKSINSSSAVVYADLTVEYDGLYYTSEWDDELEEYSFSQVDPTPEQKGAVQCLWDTFGGTLTSKGFKILDSHVGLIYGDSITLERAKDISQRLMEKGFASCNLVYGIGSYTYNMISRDCFGIAMKATYGIVDGVAREIFKDPKTDSGLKRSARGLLQVEKDGNGDYHLNERVTPEEEQYGELKVVFQDGVFFNHQTLEDIRGRLWPAK